MSFADDLAACISAAPPDDLDEACLKWAKRAVIDTIGVALAGAATDTARIPIRAIPLAPGPCQIIGRPLTCDPLNAALLNGTAAHALDFDDMTENMMGHPSVAILPPLLALAGVTPTSGDDLLRAYLVGFETAGKIGRAVTYAHHDKGWHGTSTLGIFAAIAAGAKLLAFDTPTTAAALAIVTSMSSGLRANFGTMTKPLHAGHAGRSALFALFAAREGFSANRRAFENTQGFFDVFLGPGTAKAKLALEKWFQPPEILDPGLCLKLYPSGAHTHPFIEMTRELLGRHQLRLSDIERIDVLAEQSRHEHINRPDPESALEAKWSVHYLIARTLTDGWPKLKHFTDQAVHDPHIREVMRRVEAAPDPALDRSWADKYGGTVIITTTGGLQHRARIEHMIARGPDNPMRDDELESKFLDCASPSLGPPQAKSLFDALAHLRSAPDITELLAMTADGPGA